VKSTRQLVSFIGAAFVVRDVAHLIVFRDPVGLAQITLLDVSAILLAAIARIVGPLVGRAFGGLTLFALAVGLPLAGIGAAFELLMGSPHLSKMAGFVGLAAIGVGLAGAGRWHALLGTAMAIGGGYGLATIHDPLESALVLVALVPIHVLLAVLLPDQPSFRDDKD
jgi:hypothetical protein